jgi:hypothetical protein
MRTILTAIAATTLGVTPALAGSPEPAPQDTTIATATPTPNYGPDWTGFYGGAQVGWGDVDTNLPGVSGDDMIGGLTFGYDYDMGDWVIGAGLDYDWADIGLTPGLSVDNIFRAKLRGGYKVGDGLIYGTGGYANADTSTLGDEDGYFIGAGYEHLISDQFSVGGEVLWHEFDGFNTFPSTDVEATTVQVRGTFRF